MVHSSFNQHSRSQGLRFTCTIDEPCWESVWRIDPPPFDGTDDGFLIVGAISRYRHSYEEARSAPTSDADVRTLNTLIIAVLHI